MSDGVLQEDHSFYQVADVHLLLHLSQSNVDSVGVGPFRFPRKHFFEESVNEVSQKLQNIRLA
jgi:hypothetical protein